MTYIGMATLNNSIPLEFGQVIFFKKSCKKACRIKIKVVPLQNKIRKYGK